MDDLISRQAAIEAVILSDYIKDNDVEGGATLIFEDSIIKRLHELPSAQPVDKDINVPANDLISRQAAINAVDRAVTKEAARWSLQELPSAQPTLYGYEIEHLKLIANVLQKENVPPERVAEAIDNIGRIVGIVRAEFEETLRKAVERCTI